MKTIYYNGAVYTGTLPLAEAFAVENGRFLFAGTNDAAKALAVLYEVKLVFAVAVHGISKLVLMTVNDIEAVLIGKGRYLALYVVLAIVFFHDFSRLRMCFKYLSGCEYNTFLRHSRTKPSKDC